MYIICITDILVLLHRLKANGHNSQHVPLINTPFLSMVDRLFWNLPFTSSKQAASVRERNQVPLHQWEAQQELIKAEHDLAGARDQLSRGWKQLFASEMGAVGAGGRGGADQDPVGIEVVDD